MGQTERGRGQEKVAMQLTVADIADIVGGVVIGDEQVQICGVTVFENATVGEITYVENARFLKGIDESRAGAMIVPDHFNGPAPCPIIQTANPRLGFAKLLAIFYPDKEHRPGISPQAACAADIVTGQEVSIGAFVTVGQGVCLGDRVCLQPGAFIGDGVTIGADTCIGPNVTIMERCRIGRRVKINAGTVIGSDGFGFVPDGDTYFKIQHTGIVQIDDDVEIGANSAIDRGTFGKTHICRGVKTDNLVHIAHNVRIGEDTLLVAQVGIAGSTTVGRHAILAGQAGVGQHLTIGDNAIVGPQAGVPKSIEPGAVVSGTYAMPHKIWLRLQRILPGLPALVKRFERLEKRLKMIEDEQDQ